MPYPPASGASRDGDGIPSPVSRLAMAAVVIAVGNMVFGSFLGLFFPAIPAAVAVVTVVLGHLALVRLRKSGYSGRGLALTALVLGYLWLAFMTLLIGGMLLFTRYGFAVLGF